MLFIVSILCALNNLAAAQTIDDCPHRLPRDEFLQVYGDSCFRFVFSHEREYTRAEEDCESHGGTLALVKSQDVQDYLTNQVLNTYGQLGGRELWIGLNDLAEEGTYVWVDGSSMEYSNWGVQPLNYASMNDYEDCVALSPFNSGKWIRFRCTLVMVTGFLIDARRPYICQYKVNEAYRKILKFIPYT